MAVSLKRNAKHLIFAIDLTDTNYWIFRNGTSQKENSFSTATEEIQKK